MKIDIFAPLPQVFLKDCPGLHLNGFAQRDGEAPGRAVLPLEQNDIAHALGWVRSEIEAWVKARMAAR